MSAAHNLLAVFAASLSLIACNGDKSSDSASTDGTDGTDGTDDGNGGDGGSADVIDAGFYGGACSAVPLTGGAAGALLAFGFGLARRRD